MYLTSHNLHNIEREASISLSIYRNQIVTSAGWPTSDKSFIPIFPDRAAGAQRLRIAWKGSGDKYNSM